MNMFEKDRRMHQRLRNIVNVRYTVKGRSKRKYESVPRDICGGGVGLCLSEELSRGTILDLEITCPDNPQQPILGTGEVLWISPVVGVVEGEQGTNLYQAGIRFTDINPISIGRIYTYSRQKE